MESAELAGGDAIASACPLSMRPHAITACRLLYRAIRVKISLTQPSGDRSLPKSESVPGRSTRIPGQTGVGPGYCIGARDLPVRGNNL